MEDEYGLACYWITDTLTGAFVRGMMRTLDPAAGLAVVNPVKFREVNQRFGHVVGDVVLRTIASRLGQELASSRIFRSGGAEFAIELATRPDPPQAAALAGRIAESLAAPIPEIGAGVEVRVGFSPEPVGSDWECAWAMASRAEYEAGLARVPFAIGSGKF